MESQVLETFSKYIQKKNIYQDYFQDMNLFFVEKSMNLTENLLTNVCSFHCLDRFEHELHIFFSFFQTLIQQFHQTSTRFEVH